MSIGLSFNKFLAKIASDLGKPRGFSVIGRAEAVAFLAPKPVSLIWGVGKAMQARLAEDGIRTIGALQRIAETDLAPTLRVDGAPPRPAVARRRQPKRRPSRRGEERQRRDHLRRGSSPTRDGSPAILRSLSEKVSRRLKQQGLAGRTVTLKLKTADFRLRTRSRQLADPTRLADRIFHEGSTLLAKEADGTRYRLIGIGISEFADPNLADPVDLVDPGATKRAAAEAAMDTIRGKFGNRAVETGLVFDGGRVTPRPRQVLGRPCPRLPGYGHGVDGRSSSPVSFPDSENSP